MTNENLLNQIEAVMDTSITEVPGFAELQHDIRVLGAAIAADAIASRDVTILEAMRTDVATSIEFAIKVIVERMDHDTWHSSMIQINRDAAMLNLPQGTQIKELQDRLEQLDSHEYYNVEITKLFEMDPEELRRQMVQILADMDTTIAELKAEQANNA
jgi:hypothetical protein